MAVITREVFLKGKLFQMGDEIGVTDRDLLARLSLKWNLAAPGVTVALVGADLPEQLVNSLSVLDDPALSPEEERLLAQLTQSPTFQSVSAEKTGRFLGGNQ